MTEKGPTVGAKQIAMSRALGAAFLSHQVEQLERTVVASRGKGGGAGNWRDRRQQQFQGGRATVASQPQSRRGPAATATNTTAGPPRSPQTAPSAARSAPAVVLHDQSSGKGRTSPASTRRRPSDEESGKDADVVVIDASVLIHALYQVKRWCQQGRQEVVIVPLEALNTLDLLKKGTSSLAQRARAASRILEAQVGTNSRIRVQRDDAFVFWDKIGFNNATTNATTTTTTANTTTTTNGAPPNQTLPSPEWVRRTICCAKWEATNAHITLGIDNESNTTSATNPPRVVFAVLSTSASSPQSSPQSKTMGLESGSPTDTTPVVPLPAPTMVPNKFEPRSSGTLVSHWATQAGVEVLQVEASVPGHGRVGLADDDEGASHGTHASHASHGKATKGMGGGGGGYGYSGGHYGHGRRKASLVSGGTGAYTNAHNNNNGNGIPGSTGLVERPPAVMAMMEMVSSQPSNKGKVVRVLARGEKLDP